MRNSQVAEFAHSASSTGQDESRYYLDVQDVQQQPAHRVRSKCHWPARTSPPLRSRLRGKAGGRDVGACGRGAAAQVKQGPDKTDHGDAWHLANLIRVNYLPEVWLADETTRELRHLVRHRQALSETESTPLHRLADRGAVTRWIRRDRPAFLECCCLQLVNALIE